LLFDTTIWLEAHIFAKFPVLFPDSREFASTGDRFARTASTTSHNIDINLLFSSLKIVDMSEACRGRAKRPVGDPKWRLLASNRGHGSLGLAFSSAHRPDQLEASGPAVRFATRRTQASITASQSSRTLEIHF
jgi:hypothetical protein